ncbi:hypothetical protein AYO44_05710 [Planctomycetaceae bacterium SCGC AG-212-F19]|nr:hypothetical protein AYO44_05710 [Planctomycetaceae bacterium SCGC AG-212-F19]
MVANVIICPACRKHLKVRGSWPPSKRVACPACGESLHQPVVPTAAAAARSARSTGFGIGMVAALVLVGASFAMGAWFTRPASAAPPVVVASDNQRIVHVSPLPATPFGAVAQPGKVSCTVEKPDLTLPSAVGRETVPQHPAYPEPAAIAAVATPSSVLPSLGLPNVPQIIVDPQIGYAQLMNQGAVAMLDGRYDEARSAYVEALQLAPHADAAGAASYAPASAPPTAYHPSAPDRCDWRANAVVAPPCDLRRLPVPNSSGVALDGLRQAGYAKAMASGDADMRTQHYDLAVNAFQDALRNRPGDRLANSCLIQARALAL